MNTPKIEFLGCSLIFPDTLIYLKAHDLHHEGIVVILMGPVILANKYNREFVYHDGKVVMPPNTILEFVVILQIDKHIQISQIDTFKKHTMLRTLPLNLKMQYHRGILKYIVYNNTFVG